ncbi:MAG: DUF1062 domain-containing protein [Steroidobacter sp.]
MGYRYERWRIRPAQAPRLWRYCSGCRAASEFICGRRFRINAQKKYLDVWLKYLCASCATTWKLPVFERTAVSALPPALLDALARHDPATIDRYANDLDRLRPHAIRIESDPGQAVERIEIIAGADGIEIELNVAGACELRLDRLLARELRISRSALNRGVEQRRITIEPPRKDPLRRSVCDGQRVRIASQLLPTVHDARGIG